MSIPRLCLSGGGGFDLIIYILQWTHTEVLTHCCKLKHTSEQPSRAELRRSDPTTPGSSVVHYCHLMGRTLQNAAAAHFHHGPPVSAVT